MKSLLLELGSLWAQLFFWKTEVVNVSKNKSQVDMIK